MTLSDRGGGGGGLPDSGSERRSLTEAGVVVANQSDSLFGRMYLIRMKTSTSVELQESQIG